jgi:hypothetical protein
MTDKETITQLQAETKQLKAAVRSLADLVSRHAPIMFNRYPELLEICSRDGQETRPHVPEESRAA